MKVTLMDANKTIPLACTLTPQQLRAERSELLPGLMERAETVSELQNGVRLSFVPQPDLLVDLARMMEREQQCCQFLRFRLEVEPQAGITLDVTGPEGTRELLHSLRTF